MGKAGMTIGSVKGWTGPYCGYHNKIIGKLQLTVLERSTFVEAYVLDLNSIHPFTATVEEMFKVDEVEEAKKWAERMAVSGKANGTPKPR